MKWLLKRLLIMCLTMGILCAAAVVVGRLDHSPSKLQAYDIEPCNRDLCIKGIKVGTDWATIKKTFPVADNSSVNEIQIWTKTDNAKLRFDAGDVITQFGDPCVVEIGDYGGEFFLGYPKLTFLVGANRTNDGPTYQLRPNSPVILIGIFNRKKQEVCKGVEAANIGPWHGFISDRSYISRNQRDLDLPSLNISTS